MVLQPGVTEIKAWICKSVLCLDSHSPYNTIYAVVFRTEPTINRTMATFLPQHLSEQDEAEVDPKLGSAT